MAIDDLHIEHHASANVDDPQVIVLVHGTPDRSTTFSNLLPLLADRYVVTYDRRGYGRSVSARPPTSMLDHANDLIDLVESLHSRPTTRSVAVVAHSFGSNPTMLAATRRPELFSSIGLWEPPLVWTDPWPASTKAYHEQVAASTDPAAIVDEIFRVLIGADVWDATPADVRARRLAEGPAFQVDMATSLVAPFDFADVDVPALVGVGTTTGGGHLPGAHWLAEHLPLATLHVVEGTGHFAVRTHPDLYAEFVRRAAALSLSPS